MEMFLKEIESCLDKGLHYAAVTLALTVPGVCAALISPSGDTVGKDKSSYINWFDQNLSTMYPEITGQDLYSLRCGVLHQGKFGHPKMQYDKILFMLPHPIVQVHRGYFENIGGTNSIVFQLDADTFCRDVVAAARQWLSKNQGDPNVQKNLPLLVQFRPSGIKPWIVGLPIIA